VRPSAWIFLFAAAGFGITAVFSGELRLPRDLLVLAYLLLGGGVVVAFWRAHRETFASHLKYHWPAGVLVGLGLGALLALTVASQPGSPPPGGLQLVWGLLWLGLVYGVLDALLLNVLPVMVLKRRPSTGSSWLAHVRVAATALAASMLVTAAYHVGYREFRGPNLAQPLIGNAALTAGYLLTGNPLAPLLGHVIMHGAAVLHGLETTVQLPPHYSPSGVNGHSARSRQPARP
jgi:hypothetical protein